eukprot:scaffold40989_cov59-Phaeocystis_antarctica.AAC.4
MRAGDPCSSGIASEEKCADVQRGGNSPCSTRGASSRQPDTSYPTRACSSHFVSSPRTAPWRRKRPLVSSVSLNGGAIFWVTWPGRWCGSPTLARVRARNFKTSDWARALLGSFRRRDAQFFAAGGAGGAAGARSQGRARRAFPRRDVRLPRPLSARLLPRGPWRQRARARLALRDVRRVQHRREHMVGLRLGQARPTASPHRLHVWRHCRLPADRHRSKRAVAVRGARVARLLVRRGRRRARVHCGRHQPGQSHRRHGQGRRGDDGGVCCRGAAGRQDAMSTAPPPLVRVGAGQAKRDDGPGRSLRRP